MAKKGFVLALIAFFAMSVPVVMGGAQVEVGNVTVEFGYYYVSDLFADNFVPSGGWGQYAHNNSSEVVLEGQATKALLRATLRNAHDMSEERDYEFAFLDSDGNLLLREPAGTGYGKKGREFAWPYIGDVVAKYGSEVTIQIFSRKNIGMTGGEDGLPLNYTRIIEGELVTLTTCRGPWVFEGEVKIPPGMNDTVVAEMRIYDLGARHKAGYP